LSRTSGIRQLGVASLVVSLAGAALGLLSCRSDDIGGPVPPATPPAASAVATGYSLALFWTAEGLSPAGINKSGKIAGTRGSCPAACYPFIWTSVGGFRTVNGFPAGSFAVDINNSSQVLIVTQTSGVHSFVWSRLNGIRQLPSMGRAVEQGAAMNRYGDVAGHGANLIGGSIRPAFWPAAGGVVDIVPPEWQGSGMAKGLNNKGRVVGILGIGSSTPLAGFPTPCPSCGFMWDRLIGLRRIPIASRRISPAAINDAGQIVGWFLRDGVYHAFRWTPGSGPVEIGTLGGDFTDPVAINDLGVVVGGSRIDAGGLSHPFVWDEQRGIVDLGLPDGAIEGSATDINLDGVITGYVLFPGPLPAMAIWTPL
jgi:probable HAF family extracellular repeat protein